VLELARVPPHGRIGSMGTDRRWLESSEASPRPEPRRRSLEARARTHRRSGRMLRVCDQECARITYPDPMLLSAPLRHRCSMRRSSRLEFCRTAARAAIAAPARPAFCKARFNIPSDPTPRRWDCPCGSRQLFVLLCQAALSDLRIETYEITTPRQARNSKRLPARRDQRALPLSHDVMGFS